MSTPAGWYPQPDNPAVLRWWDGSGWTDQTKPAAQTVPAAKPRPKFGLAVTAAALTLVGLVGSPLGFVAGLVLIAAVVFAIVALAKRQRLKGLAIASLFIAPIMLIVTISLASSPTPSPAAPSATKPFVATDYKEMPERDLAVLVKDPESHKGEMVVLHARVTQFDTATGGCSFRAEAAHVRPEDTFGYNHNSFFVGGAGGVSCDQLKSYVDKDEVKVLATVKGLVEYKTMMGGQTAAPEFRVDQIERLASK
ncbi:MULTISPECIES: DUF2510 domain-containing protein [unclassified Arthrobacter]|uniref:DUF2510 domain-containing protein n=1 Tax=unclassified Arthrobacter TaxID=235627 RepID=UPI0027D90EF1|nr:MULTISPECIES: DUF2510 domain-containing protein [unclassified Arthrobacter]